jgi:hypothetical protein
MNFQISNKIMEKPQTTQAQKAVREPFYTKMTQIFFGNQ